MWCWDFVGGCREWDGAERGLDPISKGFVRRRVLVLVVLGAPFVPTHVGLLWQYAFPAGGGMGSMLGCSAKPLYGVFSEAARLELAP